MGTGVCLKGTKNVPIKHSQSYFYLMMYIFIEMLLSFKITFNIFVWDFGELNRNVYPSAWKLYGAL